MLQRRQKRRKKCRGGIKEKRLWQETETGWFRESTTEKAMVWGRGFARPKREVQSMFTGGMCRNEFEFPQTPNPYRLSRSVEKWINDNKVLAVQKTALDVGDVSSVCPKAWGLFQIPSTHMNAREVWQPLCNPSTRERDRESPQQAHCLRLARISALRGFKWETLILCKVENDYRRYLMSTSALYMQSPHMCMYTCSHMHACKNNIKETIHIKRKF